MDHFDRVRTSAANPHPPFLTSGDLPRPPIQGDRQQLSNPEPHPPNLMRGAKRKRLAKACDACHKSKRRCDGTAPCSNCYFASKECTYTDASGRPVPAPHRFDPARANLLGPPPVDNRIPFHPPPVPLPADRYGAGHRMFAGPGPHTSLSPNDNSDDDRRNPRKRFRNDRGHAISLDDLVIDGPIVTTLDRPRTVELDNGLMRELTNLFFTHCHPARAIIHKPTFSSNLSHNKVPKYLLHAVCALAAPLSKQGRIRTSPMRLAGRPFAQEALSLMFDGAGRLKCEPNLAAAQALCLLQMHDIVTKERNAEWSSHYHDMALTIVEGLGVHSPEHPTLTPVPSPEFISHSLEREAIRRIFWYIHLLDLKASIYFKKPITFTDAELRLRLPVDETSFELGVHSTLPEYLYLPAVRTQYASEFGHLIRIISIYAKVESILDAFNASYQDSESLATTHKALFDCEQQMEHWARTLPEHLRFSEENLQVQQSMFETSSNTGAWCWCLLHIYHASCALALTYARQRNQRDATMEPQWALSMIDSILRMVGDRSKNSLLLGAALWSLIKYCRREDPQMRIWVGEYEESFGTRMPDLVNQWPSQPSPPQRHQYSVPGQSTSMQTTHGQGPLPRPSHRLSDARHPGNLTHNGRLPLAQHGDSSATNSRRSPNRSPGTTHSYLHSTRYADDDKSAGEGPSRLHPPHVLSDSRDSHPTPALPPLPPPPSINIANRGPHPFGPNDPKLSIKSEPEGNGFRSSDKVSGKRRSPDSNSLPSGSGASRSHPGGDSSQSLPSLKASGLLDLNTETRIIDRQVQGHGPKGPERRPSPRRSEASLPPLYSNEPRTTIPPLSLPVGMKWLANESR